MRAARNLGRFTLDMAHRASAASLDELLRVCGLAWGRLAPERHEPCHPVRTSAPLAVALAPTLF